LFLDHKLTNKKLVMKSEKLVKTKVSKGVKSINIPVVTNIEVFEVLYEETELFVDKNGCVLPSSQMEKEPVV